MQDVAYPLTTVITPATSRLLTTKAHVRDDLKIASGVDDAYLDRLITSQSKVAEQYCNRTFALQTYQDVWRIHRRLWHVEAGTHDFEPLMLRNVPVTAVSSIVEDDGDTPLVLDTDFEVDLEHGLIYRLDGNDNRCAWRVEKVVVQYTAGFTLPTQGKSGETFTLPADLEEAVIRLIKARYMSRTRDSALKQENIPGVIEQSWWVSNGSEGNIPPDIREVLDNYRKPAVA